MDMQDAIEEVSIAINALTAEMRGIRNELERLNGGPVIRMEPPVDTRTAMQKKWDAGEMD
jgi:hypothetical protein